MQKVETSVLDNVEFKLKKSETEDGLDVESFYKIIKIFIESQSGKLKNQKIRAIDFRLIHAGFCFQRISFAHVKFSEGGKLQCIEKKFFTKRL